MSKEVGTPRYLNLVVPLKKVGDEAVHKELGDRMEMAATTAFSLEAEQDSGSGPRCQDTILRDVGTQTSIQFLLLVYINAAKLMLMLLDLVNAVRHMLMLPVQVPAAEESDGFAEITDFLKASSVHYALTIQALIDKKKLIITEASIRSDLHLEDAEGTDCLPTATIFEERGTAKSTAWNEFSSTMASLIICLATNQKFNLSKYIFDAIVKHLDGGVKFLMRITPLFDTMIVQAFEEVGEDSDHLTDSNHIPIVDQPSTSSQPKQKQKSKRRQRKEAEVAHDETEHEESVLDLEKAKDAQAKEIVDLKKRVQRLERKKKSRTTGLKRLKKVGMSRRVETYKDQESLGDHEDASKQGRSIKDIDANAEVTLVNETQERQDDDLMFDTGVLDADEVFVDVTTVEKEEQSTKTGEAVTTAGVEDSVAPTISTTVEETLAQTLMEIKAVKPKAKGIVFHDQEEQVSISKPTISVTQPSIKDKGKSIMQEPERPLKIKDQVALDEQMARDIQA
ncbi:hypothetical protein Tco_1465690 [Tanacetum coccineum]